MIEKGGKKRKDEPYFLLYSLFFMLFFFFFFNHEAIFNSFIHLNVKTFYSYLFIYKK